MLQLVRGRARSFALVTSGSAFPIATGGTGWGEGLLSLTLATAWQMRGAGPALLLSGPQGQVTLAPASRISSAVLLRRASGPTLPRLPLMRNRTGPSILLTRGHSPTCHRLGGVEGEHLSLLHTGIWQISHTPVVRGSSTALPRQNTGPTFLSECYG